MHGAPSVEYPVGRSLFLLLVIASLLAAGGALLAAWLMNAAVDEFRAAAGSAAWAAAAAGSVRWWLGSPVGVLACSDGTWDWAGTARCEQPPLVTVDIQSAMLLHWASGPMPRWLWLERAAGPARWDDLRRAVYSRARPDARPSASPP